MCVAGGQVAGLAVFRLSTSVTRNSQSAITSVATCSNNTKMMAWGCQNAWQVMWRCWWVEVGMKLPVCLLYQLPEPLLPLPNYLNYELLPFDTCGTDSAWPVDTWFILSCCKLAVKPFYTNLQTLYSVKSGAMFLEQHKLYSLSCPHHWAQPNWWLQPYHVGLTQQLQGVLTSSCISLYRRQEVYFSNSFWHKDCHHQVGKTKYLLQNVSTTPPLKNWIRSTAHREG